MKLDIMKHFSNTWSVQGNKGTMYVVRKFEDLFEVELFGKVLFTTPLYNMALKFIKMKLNQ